MKAKSLFNCRCDIYDLLHKLGDEFWECVRKSKRVFVYFEASERLKLMRIADVCIDPIQREIARNGGEFSFRDEFIGDWTDVRVINFWAVISYQ
ncbi:hypothetical protein LMG7974_01275 [Campylobacter majalis]|uniref:Uncharacterized protein n=1 Tax=Campylobacter majalis TaxID=2790656 RepID=A0ABN7KC31_9BACT|nr:hypothetical protein [Campylobacter majalis]CAD7288970.1 hypothetical protein LMG7974_01275 [Campylobacter majalis]